MQLMSKSTVQISHIINKLKLVPNLPVLLRSNHLNPTYLSIVLEPFGSNLGDGIVLLGLAFGDATIIHGNTFTHRLQ